MHAPDALTVTGQSHRENTAHAENYDTNVIMELSAPLAPAPYIAVLRAERKELLVHTGRACVFEDIDDYHKRIDDEDLDVDENSVLVLKNCGLRGYSGMSEVSVLVYILLVLEISYHTVRENIV